MNETSIKRQKIVRQERVAPPQKKFFLIIEEIQLEVTNYSAFGLAAVSQIALPSLQEFLGVHMLYDGIELGTCHLRLVRQTEDNAPLFTYGFEILSEPIDTLFIKGTDLASNLMSLHREEIEKDKNIPADFKHKVLEIKDWLESLQENCEELESNLDWERHDVHQLRDNIAEVVGYALASDFPKIYLSLKTSLDKLPEAEIRGCIQYFRRRLTHLIYKSPLADRAFKKPLGYAGDYQMMNIVYDNPTGGNSLFAKCIHRYFIQEPATQAVRSRAQYLKSRIVKTIRETDSSRKPKILSVACGPAKELELLLTEERELVQREADIHLLDQDQSALQDAQHRLVRAARLAGSPFKFEYHNLAIKNVIVRGLPDSEYDLIYSAGLFDYFTDPVAIMASEKIFHSLKPGGVLIIGNFDITNPSQKMMELVMDWELIYRSTETLKTLYSHLGGELHVESEENEVNLFCVIKKN